jgi:hypothetical protein
MGTYVAAAGRLRSSWHAVAGRTVRLAVRDSAAAEGRSIADVADRAGDIWISLVVREQLLLDVLAQLFEEPSASPHDD